MNDTALLSDSTLRLRKNLLENDFRQEYQNNP